MNDPWKHRSEGMKCKTCMWFAPKQTKGDVAPMVEIDPETELVTRVITPPEPPVINIGRCRRHAPTMNGYPVVFVNDWCGDHKLNENTITEVP